MFAVWGWGVGINGTSSVVAVSSIFSEYMDFFYFCTCSPLKRKKKSQILCAVWGNLEWHTRSPSLAGSCLYIVQRGTWAKADSSTLQTYWPRFYAYLEKRFPSPKTLYQFNCTETSLVLNKCH